MVSPSYNAPDWRIDLSVELVGTIEAAIAQYHANIEYEANCPKLLETRAQLVRLAGLAGELSEALAALTPIASNTLWHAVAGKGLGRRSERQVFARDLSALQEISAEAAPLLVERHSDPSVTGQGSRSRMAKDPESRAVKWDPDYQGSVDFRNPKDKFGATVLEALLQHRPDYDCFRRDACKELEQFLEAVWRDVSAEPASWVRLLKGRKAIVEKGA